MHRRGAMLMRPSYNGSASTAAEWPRRKHEESKASEHEQHRGETAREDSAWSAGRVMVAEKLGRKAQATPAEKPQKAAESRSGPGMVTDAVEDMDTRAVCVGRSRRAPDRDPGARARMAEISPDGPYHGAEIRQGETFAG